MANRLQQTTTTTPCWPEQFAYGASTTLSISRIVCLEPGRCLIYHCNQSFYAALMLSFGGIDCRQLRQTKKRFYGKRKQSDAKKSALTHTHTGITASQPAGVDGRSGRENIMIGQLWTVGELLNASNDTSRQRPARPTRQMGGIYARKRAMIMRPTEGERKREATKKRFARRAESGRVTKLVEKRDSKAAKSARAPFSASRNDHSVGGTSYRCAFVARSSVRAL